ncbi:MAG: alpha/beta hydrolase [Mycobacteriaceae bacterium]|nr:alpha/beta hydrolase [Mycobacteriaceae bacterium]
MSGPHDIRTVAVEGVRSPVRVGGRAADAREADAREAVLFVHGNNAGADWSPLMTPVSEFVCVFAPDMPGFGDADKPAHWDYTVTGYAEHLNGVLVQLGVQRAHLVAHDFGGPWSLAWAADHLDAVASITLINTPVRINHLAAKIWRAPVLPEILWRVTPAAALRQIMRRQDPGLPQAAVDQIVAHTMVPATQRAVLALYRSTGEDAIGRYTERLERFTGDVLIVWGDADAYISEDQAEQQRNLFRHAQLQRVPEAGHWPWLEQPDLVAGYVTEFLRTQTAKPD